MRIKYAIIKNYYPFFKLPFGNVCKSNNLEGLPPFQVKYYKCSDIWIENGAWQGIWVWYTWHVGYTWEPTLS